MRMGCRSCIGLRPLSASLQDKGFKVALITDGRMSGASGAEPAAIHITPECVGGGPLARVRDGDVIRLDCNEGVLEVKVSAEVWDARELATANLASNDAGTGREVVSDVSGECGGGGAGWRQPPCPQSQKALNRRA